MHLTTHSRCLLHQSGAFTAKALLLCLPDAYMRDAKQQISLSSTVLHVGVCEAVEGARYGICLFVQVLCIRQ
jgi:hypothetical protein